MQLPEATEGSDPSWFGFPITVKESSPVSRNELTAYLDQNKVGTRLLFAGNITRHPAYREYLQVFPNADLIMAEGFLLGAHHGMTIEDVDYVCDKIKEFLKLS